jgi:hypothetical protein
MHLRLYPILVSFLFFTGISNNSFSYSILTHEAIVDACWDKYIQPLLKLKYPDATDQQIHDAHAYVYGGVVMPDMGYYPFEKSFLSNLVHYVRTGDFVENLLKEAQNVNEYAFALGVLCHYYGDIYGHGIGINHSEPLIYPKVKEKFGSVVTYEQDRLSHVRTEFGFDVLQTSRGNYVATNYHDFIGFKISKPVLERAFKRTYGLDLDKTFPNFKMASYTFSWSIRHLVPWFTRVGLAHNRKQVRETDPGRKGKSFAYKMHRIKSYTDTTLQDQSPGLSSYIVSFAFKIIPKFGKLRALNFKAANSDAEKIFIQSFDSTVANYSVALQNLITNYTDPDNKNYDTGKKTRKGEYGLADKSYGDLLLKLDKNNYEDMPADLKMHIISFYGNSYNGEKDTLTKKDKKIKEALEKLNSAKPVTSTQ